MGFSKGHAGFGKGHAKFGGRIKGVPNKATQQRAHAIAVYARLHKKNHMTKEDISVALLTCGIPAVVQREHALLREYLLGKPIQTNEHTGEDGGAIQVAVINYMARPER